MKNNLFTALTSFLLSISLFAGNTKNEADLKQQATQLMQNVSVKFLENRGQMMDMGGSPVPFVLFKAEAPGLNMYITEKGLTYFFVKAEEEREVEEKPRGGKNENSGSVEKDKKNLFHWERVDMELKGASIKKENIIKDMPIITNFNYFHTNCPYGIYGVKKYEKITIKDVYPGIDWVFYNSNGKGFKYDFVVHPKADHSLIKLIYSSAEKLRLTREGTIQIKTSYGNLTEQAPETFLNGEPIESRFKQLSSEKNTKGGYDITIGFGINSSLVSSLYSSGQAYNSPLIIDPQLVWSTFYGGSYLNGPMSVTTDTFDNVFVTGYLNSIDFPTQNPLGGTYFQGVFAGGANEAFILKFSNAGVLLWATYYGGSGDETGTSIAADGSGNVFVTGFTQSTNFPTQNPGGGAYFQGTLVGLNDVFILKFSNAGLRIWATYYGGNLNEKGHSIATDGNGNVFVTGYTQSINFPTQDPGGGAYFQGTIAGGSDVFILKFSNAGILLWATYYGGGAGDLGYAIDANSSGNVFVTGFTQSTNFPTQNPGGGVYFQGTIVGGSDAFILKFSSTGVRIWATYYGGSSLDQAYSIATDGSGNVFVTGYTNSTDLPTQDPGGGAYFQGALAVTYDAFILKFSSTGVRIWASYYGGSAIETLGTYDNLAIDNCGNVYMSFNTRSSNLPVQNSCLAGGYYDNSLNGGAGGQDIALLKFSNSGVRLWATYVGGDGDDYREAMAVDGNNNLYMVGERSMVASSASYPSINPGGGAYYDPTYNGGEDGYIMKFSPPFINIPVSSTPSACTCSGGATITPSGGCAPYKITWYNSLWVSVGNTAKISTLCIGSYQVIVRDTINCSLDTAFVTITGGGSGLSLGLTTSNVNCTISGTATVTPGGGIAPYTYTWSNGQTTQTATGLAAGSYTVTVADASGGCTDSATSVITASMPLFGQFTKGTADCNDCGCKQWIMVTASGGTSPYSYSWPDGYTNRYMNQLCPGTYIINIKDKNGCSVNVNLTVP